MAKFKQGLEFTNSFVEDLLAGSIFSPAKDFPSFALSPVLIANFVLDGVLWRHRFLHTYRRNTLVCQVKKCERSGELLQVLLVAKISKNDYPDSILFSTVP